MSIRAEIAPVILLGEFGLLEAPKGFVLGHPANVKLGNYAVQGYQEYPWEMAYCHTYELKDATQPHMVKLNQWNGTVAQVWGNGEKAGSIAYPPYQLEVTKYLQSGKNSIEIRLIGSMGNLYSPHYSQSMGIMGPWMWNGIQEQLPGAQYRSFNYGLAEDFRLMY